MKLTRRDRLVLFAPLVLLLTGGLVLPALLGLVATFTTYSPFSAAVRFIGVNNYLAVFHDHVFTAAVRNIAVFTVVAVPLELVIGFGLAYLLRHPIRGRALWRVLLLMPWLISPIANGVMWRFLLGPTRGLIDFALGWLGQPDLPSPIGDARLALPAKAMWLSRVGPLPSYDLSVGYAERVVYRKPNWLRRQVNRVVAWLAGVGLTPANTVRLEVRGRKSGRMRAFAVTTATLTSERYLVSLAGESDWVRNLRADGNAVIRHGYRTRVRTEEIPVPQRAAVLSAYLEKRALSKSPSSAARAYFGVEPHPPLEELERIAERYPVFKIVPAAY